MLMILSVVFLASLIGTRLILAWLRQRQIMDHPNERSSHSLPTPRGGGLAIIPVIILAWAYVGPPGILAVLGPAAGLAILSWLDDLKGLPPWVRLVAQIVAVSVVLAFWPLERGPFLGGWLPDWLDTVIAGLIWVWFINLYNFMDGIDGITGVETVVLGTGAAFVAVLSGLNVEAFLCAATIAAAAMGFLWWNWSPARIFLGDVGSVPLGFLLGGMMLYLASRGEPLAALILPGYYLADATVTLFRRLLRGEKVWQAHREHFYQKAVQAGRSHASVSLEVLGAGLFYVGLAGWSAQGATWEPVAGAIVVTALLLFHLARDPSRG